jgi:hypothetical protein
MFAHSGSRLSLTSPLIGMASQDCNNGDKDFPRSRAVCDLKDSSESHTMISVDILSDSIENKSRKEIRKPKGRDRKQRYITYGT